MKLLKMVALSYLIKTVIVGIAWLFIPDLPSRAMVVARRTWAWLDAGPTANTPANTAAALPRAE